ncbi:DUF6850 family outer membrane beta-barrel protein [Myroides odoratimimus]|uniref:DUF6850 family outer membrane beta-barrel protein n=1 Tax=Myroides odoratimimus TaxID=76832 RepID=UPI001CE1EB4E|nr:DUF6850 family outer membrane beta-barrel protein [Myroides odoratimimus]MCA4806969.1 hypothetical protein [Myroides odoratimimus]
MLLAILFLQEGIAQENNLIQLDKQNNPFDVNIRENTVFNTAYSDWYLLRGNPSFRHYFTRERKKSYDFKALSDKNLVMASVTNTKNKGDYVFYRGDEYSSRSVLASGTMDFEKEGTLYGSASYSTDKKNNTLLNYAVNPEHYYPYLVADTLGRGDQKYEVYNVQGGYGFAVKNTYYGIGFNYQGTAMSKLTDPRLSVYDSWFKIDLGVTRAFAKHLLALKASYQINKQDISAISTLYRAPSVLQFSGLGAWRNAEVTATQGYERMLDIKGFAFEFTYKKLRPEKSDFGYSFSLGYSRNTMNTEDNSQLGFESNSKLNLFTLDSHTISPLIIAEKEFSSFGLAFVLSGVNQIKKGKDHIYKSEKVSNEQNLYNYIKVASNAFYTEYDFNNTASVKATIPLRDHQRFHILTGTRHEFYKQEYVYPQQQIKSQNLSPFVSLGYSKEGRSNNLGVSMLYAYRKSLDNTYNVSRALNSISIDQSYIPFLIRSGSGFNLESQLFYSYNLAKGQRIGLRANLGYFHANKYADIFPLISNREIKSRKELSLDFKLFYMF